MKSAIFVMSGLLLLPLIGSSGLPQDGNASASLRGTGPLIDWYTIDGGGGMTFGGTLGQPDAGGPMTGGDLTLTGGFWVVAASACPNTCGDINGSGGNIDLVDFASFAVCFGQLPSSSEACACSDMNADGAINLLDFATFSLIFNAVSTNTVPNCP